MNAELAIHDILENDATYAAHIGGAGANARIYFDDAPQAATFPFCVISMQGVDPNATHDGPSDFDFDFVQVLHVAETKAKSNQMAVDARNALDRASGTYNGVVVSSIVFDDQDSFSERIVDKRLITTEQIYKAMVNVVIT